MVVFISVGWQQWFHPLLFKIRAEVVNFHCAIQLSQDFVLAWMGGDKSSVDVRPRVTCLYKLSASSRLAMERLFSLKITTRNVKGGCKCKHEVTLLVYWRRAAVSAPIWPSGKAVLNRLGECLFAEHTSDSSTNYDSFINWTFSSPNMVQTVRRIYLFSTGL